jgi:hypothetical protein
VDALLKIWLDSVELEETGYEKQPSSKDLDLEQNKIKSDDDEIRKTLYLENCLCASVQHQNDLVRD